MSEILNVLQKPIVDESIIKKDYHTYLPYLQSFKNSDEIRIAIQNQDLYILPCESQIYIEGNISYELTSAAEGKLSSNIKLKNNAMAYLFDEIRYEINGMEVDSTRYLGITSTMKNYVSLSESESKTLENAGWCASHNNNEIELVNEHFNFCIPLKILLGFAEDFNKIILNCKHELILLRSKTDTNVLYCNDDNVMNLTLTLTNVSWKIPHIQLADFSKLQLFKIINSKQPLTLSYRSWDCHFNPLLAQSTSNVWNVKLTSSNERPRFILFAFHNGNTHGEFTHCNLTDFKVHLNSVSFPYDDLNLKFEWNRYAILYDMYCKFQQAYYNREISQPILTRDEYKKKAPIIVMDLSHQNETIKTGSMDIKIEFKTTTNVPPNTSAYCLLIHDKIIQYTPLTGEMKKLI